MKKKCMVVIASVLCCMIITGFSFFAGSQETDQVKKMNPPKQVTTAIDKKDTGQTKSLQVYALQAEENGQNLFTNYVDQFSILVPQDLQVDASLPQVRSLLKNETWQVEIYRQELDEKTTAETYIRYSNQFILNKADHRKELEGDFELAGKPVHVLQWSRERLDGIADDKNYYASADVIVSEREVYSFFFKSSEPFYGCEQYLNIISSFYQRSADEKIPAAEQNSASVAADAVDSASGEDHGNRVHSIASGQWNEETKAVYDRFFSDSSPLTWGIFEFGAPEDFTKLHQLEETMNFEFPFLVYYKHFNRDGESPNLRQGLKNAKEEERILELTLQTTAQNEEEGNMVYDILNGEFDPFIDAFIADIKAVQTPVLMRFCNEMNGDWCMYSSYHTSKDTDLFIKLYQYVYEKFREADALQYTIWVWNPNEKSLPAFRWNAEELYYPGDEYVDVIGLTGYNTGTYYEGETWRTFDEIYAEAYERAVENHDKPLMITEFSCSSAGGDKEGWIDNMFASIDGYDKIKVAMWWSGRDLDAEGNIARNYRIDERSEILMIFKDHLSQYRSENVT